jgi:uncharacterized protein YqeY
MDLKTRITEDMKAAMRAREAARLSTLRLLLAAIKQRKDSIAQYEKAARQDLADKEQYEISVLEGYLPQQLSAQEIEDAIGSALAKTGASSPADMGKVMGVLKPMLAGRADMGRVSALVKARLA